ncbi:MAG: hypothetical protein RR891_03875 [Clostridium sp.]|uniref:hypothetical protein n=1 Tax=Clostridium sp. TaxID=1506 RepID=UPI003026FAF5
MKLVDDNMKKIGLAVILFGLMIVIVGFGKYFEESLKITTLTQNSMVEFNQYEILDGEIKYKLPIEWLTTVKENTDNNVYLNEFVSGDANTYGSIEVVKSENGSEAIIDQYIKEITELGINDFKRDKIKINDKGVEVVQYELRSSEKNVKKTYEYYIPVDNYMTKVTFIINDNKTKENTQSIFENIVKTFSFKK